MPVGADFLDLLGTSIRGGPDGQSTQVAAAHNGGGRRVLEAQTAHAREYALAGHRALLPEARRPRVLPSSRPQAVVRSGSAAILVRAKAVSALPLAGIVVTLALLVAPTIRQ